MLEYTKDYIERWNAAYDATKARGILVGDEFTTKDDDNDSPGGFVFIGKAKNSFFVKLVLDGAVSLSEPTFVLVNSVKKKSGLITFLCKDSVKEYLERHQTSIPKVKRITVTRRFSKIAICRVTEWCE